MTPRSLWSVAWRSLSISVIALLLLALYTTKVEPYWIEVTRVNAPIANLPSALDQFSIVQISDLRFAWNLARCSSAMRLPRQMRNRQT